MLIADCASSPPLLAVNIDDRPKAATKFCNSVLRKTCDLVKLEAQQQTQNLLLCGLKHIHYLSPQRKNRLVRAVPPLLRTSRSAVALHHKYLAVDGIGRRAV